MGTPAATTRDRPRSRVRGAAFRHDIQGLRAFAVCAVLLFHLFPSGLSGGYVGVDVFFVISGFLMASHLLERLRTTGRIRPGEFWARRAKRLLPAALLTLGATLIATVALVPRAAWRSTLNEIAGSSLYVENWVLRAHQADYYGRLAPPSPVQHFWTLSVEEQFYFMLPLGMIAATLVARAMRAKVSTTVGVALAMGAALSFGYGVWSTFTHGTTAYYGTFGRAWEFVLGCLVALAPAVRSPRVRVAFASVGVTALAVSVVLFDSFTPFPGFAALLPCVGAAMLVALGAASPLRRVGAWRPVAVIGRISYATYLWHWPLIVITPYVTGADLRVPDKVAIAAASFGLAWLSTTYVEDPVRYSPRLLAKRRPRIVALWSVIGMATVLAGTYWAGAWSSARLDADVELADRILEENPSGLGAAGHVPGAPVAPDPRLDGVLIPPPELASTDSAIRRDCRSDDGVLRVCTVGPEAGYVRHLVAVGDSHNSVLIDAYATIAENRNWRIDVAGASTCYWTTREQHQTASLARACEAWKPALVDYLTTAGPFDAIITTHSRANGVVVPEPGETVDEATINGLVEAWTPLTDQGTPVIALVDNPHSSSAALRCVESLGLRSPDGCAVSRDWAFANVDGSVEAAQRVPLARAIDLTDFYCDETSCPAIIGNVIVYRDTTHMTATFIATLTPYLEERLADAVADLSVATDSSE